MRPCWSCGAEDGPCDEAICNCKKCADPEGYAAWKENNPEAYEAWLERQQE